MKDRSNLEFRQTHVPPGLETPKKPKITKVRYKQRLSKTDGKNGMYTHPAGHIIFIDKNGVENIRLKITPKTDK